LEESKKRQGQALKISAQVWVRYEKRRKLEPQKENAGGYADRLRIEEVYADCIRQLEEKKQIRKEL